MPRSTLEATPQPRIFGGNIGTPIHSPGPLHPNAVHRREFLAFVKARRSRQRTDIHLARDVRAFLHGHPLFATDDRKRLPTDELHARLVVLFGQFVGRWVYKLMRLSVPFSQFEAIMLEDRPEERPMYDVHKADVIMEGITILTGDETITDVHIANRRLMRLDDIDSQRDARRSFAEHLEDRAGEVNPRRMYRQWLQTLPNTLYTKHTRIHKDAIARIGKHAAEYIWKTPKATRKAMAAYMRSL